MKKVFFSSFVLLLYILGALCVSLLSGLLYIRNVGKGM